MRRVFGLLLLLPILAGAARAQGRSSVVITAKSQTDKPATSNQASDEATALSHHLENQVAIAIQDFYPCVSATSDQDITALLQWERGHQLLDPNYEGGLENIARSWGARYLILVTATQMDGKEYMTASCVDLNTSRPVAKQDAVTGEGDDAVSGADSLASKFVGSLAGLFAVSPEPGKTYPVGTTLKAVCKPAGANYEEPTWTNFQCWDKSIGGYGPIAAGYSPSVPQGGTCTARFTTPGRYRMVIISGRWDRVEKYSIAAEFTIEGPCRK